MADRPTPTLTVVMPAYNEAGVIRDVVSAWDHQLETLGRRIVTAVAGWTIRVGFGARVRDPNAPYRLFRRAALARLLPAVPADAFAPNVILTGLACGNGLRVVEVAVPYRRRRTGTTSIARLRLLRGAALSFVQTVRVARARSTR